METSSWKFDVDEIQQEIMISDSLADLLQMKIRRLPKEVQNTLIIAAMLGFTFSSVVVVDVFVKLHHNKKRSDPGTESLPLDWAQLLLWP